MVKNNLVNLLTQADYVYEVSDDVGHNLNISDKAIYQKMKDNWKENTFWSTYQEKQLPLCLPATKGNRATNLAAIAKSINKGGFNPALWSNPRAVAIPAEHLKEALNIIETLKDDYFIVSEGWLDLPCPYTNEVKSYYVFFIDGEHRRLAEAARQGINIEHLSSVLQLPSVWNVSVTFANTKCWEDAERALKLANALMGDINANKVRQWTGQDLFFTRIQQGDNKALKQAKQCKLAGVKSENGRMGVGEQSGVKVKITQYEKALSDVRLNDNIRALGTELFREWIKDEFNQDAEYPAIWTHACARLVESCPSLSKKNKLWDLLCEYGYNHVLASRGFKKWAAKVKKNGAMREGVNAHHNEQMAIAVELAEDFKTWLQGDPQYNNFNKEEALSKIKWFPEKKAA